MYHHGAIVHNSHYKFICMKYEVDILHIVEFKQEFVIAIFHAVCE